MKKISEHLGAILTTIAAIALCIGIISLSAPSVTGLFGSVVDTQGEKAENMLMSMWSAQRPGNSPGGTITGLPDPDPDHAAPVTGDEFEDTDYIYKYNYRYESWGDWKEDESLNGWGVKVKDTSKESYGEIYSTIWGAPVTTLNYTFKKCAQMTTAPVIPNTVTTMTNTFEQCTKLTTAPAIPNSVTGMEATFLRCEVLAEAPAIPNSVITMNQTFSNCYAITEAPVIPNSVEDMSYTFNNCTGLTDLSDLTIPGSVKNMLCTFSFCFNLTEGPVISEGVENMQDTFARCEALTKAPVIPSSVTNMRSTFDECFALTGEVVVNANPTKTQCAFCGTKKAITVVGSASDATKSALAATETRGNLSYVTAGGETLEGDGLHLEYEWYNGHVIVDEEYHGDVEYIFSACDGGWVIQCMDPEVFVFEDAVPTEIEGLPTLNRDEIIESADGRLF